jgi:hypothetical protein
LSLLLQSIHHFYRSMRKHTCSLEL